MEGEKVQEIVTGNWMNVMVLIVAIMAGLGTVRKPKFEVKSRTASGSAINWLNIAVGDTIHIGIEQVYFGMGSMFEEAGFMTPDGKREELCALVIARSQISHWTNKGNEVVWVMTLMTQRCVDDLYSSLLESKYSKAIPQSKLMTTPLDFDVAEFDGFTAKNSNVHLKVKIEHKQDPLNPARSRYELDFDDDS